MSDHVHAQRSSRGRSCGCGTCPGCAGDARAEAPAVAQLLRLQRMAGNGAVAVQLAPGAKSFSFAGKTLANYHSDFTTSDETQAGKMITGTLNESFQASPAVTLPPVPSGVDECQATAIDNAINTTLAAHEQQHVDAFNDNYNGSTTTPFSVPAGGYPANVAPIHAKNDRTRQAAANAVSQALDPFTINVKAEPCDP